MPAPDDFTDSATSESGPSRRGSKPRERRRLGQIPVDSGALTAGQLEQALAEQTVLQLPLGQTLIKLNFTTDEIMRQALCAQLGVPYIDLGHVIIDRTLGQWIDRDFARRHALLPIAKMGRTLTVAMDDPTASSIVEELQRVTEHGVTVVTSSAQAIQQALHRLYDKPAARASGTAPALAAAPETRPEPPAAGDGPDGTRHRYAALVGLMTFEFEEVLRSIESGLAYRALDEMVENTGLPVDRVAELADLSGDTLARRKQEGRFSRDESDRLLRAARIFALAEQALQGNRTITIAWLMSGQPALGGRAPIEMAGTDLGARAVESVISRLTTQP